jgi:hypothetical protein
MSPGWNAIRLRSRAGNAGDEQGGVESLPLVGARARILVGHGSELR